MQETESKIVRSSLTKGVAINFLGRSSFLMLAFYRSASVVSTALNIFFNGLLRELRMFYRGKMGHALLYIPFSTLNISTPGPENPGSCLFHLFILGINVFDAE